MKVVIEQKIPQKRQPKPAQATLPPTAPLAEKVVATLRTVYDPELPVNVYDLGLIYNIKTTATTVHVTMTLTAPNCPVADEIVKDVETKLNAIEDVSAKVKLVFDPPWHKDLMSDAAKLELGLL